MEKLLSICTNLKCRLLAGSKLLSAKNISALVILFTVEVCACTAVFAYISYAVLGSFPRFVRLFISSSLTFELFIIIDGSMAEWRIEPNIYLQSINKHKYILLRFFYTGSVTRF